VVVFCYNGGVVMRLCVVVFELMDLWICK